MAESDSGDTWQQQQAAPDPRATVIMRGPSSYTLTFDLPPEVVSYMKEEPLRQEERRAAQASQDQEDSESKAEVKEEDTAADEKSGSTTPMSEDELPAILLNLTQFRRGMDSRLTDATIKDQVKKVLSGQFALKSEELLQSQTALHITAGAASEVEASCAARRPSDKFVVLTYPEAIDDKDVGKLWEYCCDSSPWRSVRQMRAILRHAPRSLIWKAGISQEFAELAKNVETVARRRAENVKQAKQRLFNQMKELEKGLAKAAETMQFAAALEENEEWKSKLDTSSFDVEALHSNLKELQAEYQAIVEEEEAWSTVRAVSPSTVEGRRSKPVAGPSIEGDGATSLLLAMLQSMVGWSYDGYAQTTSAGVPMWGEHAFIKDAQAWYRAASEGIGSDDEDCPFLQATSVDALCDAALSEWLTDFGLLPGPMSEAASYAMENPLEVLQG